MKKISFTYVVPYLFLLLLPLTKTVYSSELSAPCYQDLPIVMQEVPTSFPEWQDNEDALWVWNQHMGIYSSVPSGPNDLDGRDGVNEFCGFLSDNVLYSVYGFHWSDGLALTWIHLKPYDDVYVTNQIIETDVIFNPAYKWTYNRDEAEDDYSKFFYGSTLLHELGHTWGLQTDGEDYEYSVPTVMHAYGIGVVQDYNQIHVNDAQILRSRYADQTSIPTLFNFSVVSKYADATHLNWTISTTDKRYYLQGETITVNNLTVENTGTVPSSAAQILLYLSTNRNITTSDYLIGSFTWQNFPTDTYTVCSPSGTTASVPPGTYYVGAMVKCNCISMWEFDELPFDNTTHLYKPITIYSPAEVAPSNLNVIAHCNAVVLTWIPSAYPVDGFKIYSGPNCSSLSCIATVGNNSTNYPLNTSSPSCYKVCAYGSPGEFCSGTVSGTPLTVPAASSNLTATAVSQTQINLSWTDNSSGETGYKIERALDNAGNPGTFAQIGTVGADVTTFQDAGLSPNTKYWYRVRAYNTCGDSAYSNVITASTTTSTTSTQSTTSTTTISQECISDDDCEDDGVFCNGHEICTLEERCVSSGNPCPEGTECIEEDEICREEPPPDTCELSIYPPNESVFTGETIQFSAMESGNCTTPCYTWEVVGGTGDTTGSMGSTIDSSGWYTAGYTSGTDIVIVTDSCNYDISALSIVTVEESPVTTTSTTISSTTTTACICPVVCVFGMSSEEAELLRYLRDHVLSQTPEGQELIRLYYEWSPVVLKAMQNDEEFKAQVKETIDGVLPLIR